MSDRVDVAVINRLGTCCAAGATRPAWDAWPAAAWTEIEQLARQHAVGGLLLNRLTQHGLPASLPADVHQRLTADTRAVAAANLRRFAALKSICERFASLHLPVMLLKGAHLATGVYADPSMRQMIDIDLLVPAPRVDDAIDACRALGFGTNRPPTGSADPEARHARPLSRPDGGTVELHWTIARAEHAPGLTAAELWDRSQPARFDASARVLCPSDLLLHVATHAAYDHQLNQGLRPLLDLAEIANRHGDDAFWAAVIDGARRWGVGRGVGVTLWVARELAGAAVPHAVIDALVPELSPDVQSLAVSQACQPARLRVARRRVGAVMSASGASKVRYGLRKLLPPARQASLEYGVPRWSLAFHRHYFLEAARRIRRHAPDLLRWQFGSDRAAKVFVAEQQRFYEWLMPVATPGTESASGRIRRLLGRDGRSTLLAFAAVTTVSVALHVVGFHRTVRWLERTAAPAETPRDAAVVRRLATALRRVARYAPWAGRCLARSLALWWLLRREGVRAQLGIGVNVQQPAIDAHAWVISGGRVVGDQQSVADRFAAVFVSDDSLSFAGDVFTR